jgi:hypothetical protein
MPSSYPLQSLSLRRRPFANASPHSDSH